MKKRGRSPLVSMIVFAAICAFLPTISLYPSQMVRDAVFYILASIFGFAFGSAFARFQDLTWQVLPPLPDGDVANAMGFNVMCRLFGVGLGDGRGHWHQRLRWPSESCGCDHHANWQGR